LGLVSMGWRQWCWYMRGASVARVGERRGMGKREERLAVAVAALGRARWGWWPRRMCLVERGGGQI
jgi:hypothetical protein